MHKYAPELKPGDIEITSSGATGEDLKLSPSARSTYPFVIEVKNVEKINIWESLEQARSHFLSWSTEFISWYKTATPVLFFRRNKSELMVAMKAEDFLKLLKGDKNEICSVQK